MWSRCRACFALFGLVVLGSWSVTLCAPQSAGGASSRSDSRPTLVLRDQSQWVEPPPRGSAAPFDIVLAARGAPAGAQVTAVLYPRLDTRDAFKSTVKYGPYAYPISRTQPVALSSLPAAAGGPGGAQLAIQVVRTGEAQGRSALGLGCAPPTGTGICTGVYPVEIRLLTPSGSLLSRLTTFLTYVAQKSAHPLELAWVVPLRAPVAITPRAPDPAAAIAPMTSREAASLGSLIATLHANPQVPVTIDASPETLQALEQTGTAGRAADASLAAMSADQATTQILPQPYVPIDLGALEGAGEPTEIVAQMAAGATVMHKLGLRSSATPEWVATGPAGSALAAGLARIDATQVVVPESDLTTTSTPSAGTWTATFKLRLGRSTSTSAQGAETDSWLDEQFSSLPRDPGLAATQILADLAMVHFERPNTTAVRGMVAVPPVAWTASSTFDRVLISGLEGNPTVQAVTLAKYFSSVGSNGTRYSKTTGTGPVLQHSLAVDLSSARLRLTNFDNAIVGNPTIESQLDELLLAGETSQLTRTSHAAAVATFNHALETQLHKISFSTEHTFTLTARTGWIPLTVESRAPYVVVGTLSVSGARFEFPHRSFRTTMHLDHATNTWRVDVDARTSGDLPLHVEFTSPNGKLVIAQGLVRVQSTATSVVGVVLTVAALAILCTWWIRTWWAGRRERRRRGASADPA